MHKEDLCSPLIKVILGLDLEERSVEKEEKENQWSCEISCLKLVGIWDNIQKKNSKYA